MEFTVASFSFVGCCKKKWKLIAGLVIFVIVLISLIMFIFSSLRNQQQKTSSHFTQQIPTVTSTPTPIPFTHKGKMEFTINTSGTFAGPKFTECAIDPLDPHSTRDQFFTIVIGSERPITEAIATWITDHGEHSVPLSLTSGTPTQGVWSGKWSVDDTAWYRYQIMIRASDGTRMRETAVTLR